MYLIYLVINVALCLFTDFSAMDAFRIREIGRGTICHGTNFVLCTFVKQGSWSVCTVLNMGSRDRSSEIKLFLSLSSVTHIGSETPS
jgi:hypothetical protein